LDNYLSAEGLIISRIQSAVPGLNFVGGSRSIKELTDRLIGTPAVIVVFAGDNIKEAPGQSADNGTVQVITQRWHIELVINNHTDFVAGTGERAEAGAFLAQIISALAGWAPSTQHREMKRVQSPMPVYVDGYGYFPLTFQTELVTQ